MTLDRRAVLVAPGLLLHRPVAAQVMTAQMPCVDQPGDIVGLLLEGQGEPAAAIAVFGQAFRAGDLPRDVSLGARLAGRQGGAVTVQCDIKTRHADGSARFAVISLAAPALAPAARAGVVLTRESSRAPMGRLDIAALLARHRAEVTLGGTTLDLMELLRGVLTTREGPLWQEGPLAVQARVMLPVTGVSVTSLRLVADITLFADGVCSIDLWVRNDIAMRPGGGPLTYTLDMSLNGAKALVAEGVRQYHYTGWGRLVGTRHPPPLIRHDTAYLAEVGAVPRYDLTTGVEPALLAAMAEAMRQRAWANALGGRGVTQNMSVGGARADIGPVTQPQAIWLQTGDPRAAAFAIGQAEAAGAIPWHFWDGTDPRGGWMDTRRWPRLWTDGRGGPPPGGLLQPIASDTGWNIVSSHQPDLSFVPYLLTGRRAFLDELQAQASWNVLGQWSGARGTADRPGLAEGVNLVRRNQVRGAAWSLRQLDGAAWAGPDGEAGTVWARAAAGANWAWLRAQLPVWTAAQGEAHGWIPGEYGTPGLLPPWQQDYFASTAAAAARRGSADAAVVLAWMGNFLAGRFLAEGRGFARHDGAAYLLAMNADASVRAPLRSWAEIGAATRAASLSNGDGWSKTEGDYAQLALASLAALWDVTGAESAREAYTWLSRANAPFTRPESYRRDPILNIVPRGMPRIAGRTPGCAR